MGDRVWVCDDDVSSRFPVYTRGNVGEVFVEAVSPLTWSAYGPHAWDAGWRDAFCEIGLFTRDEFGPEGRCEIVGCFGGYVYINMSVTRVLAVRIPGMTVEAIDRSLFGDAPDVPPYRADERDVDPERTKEVAAWLASLFTTDPLVATSDDTARVSAVARKRPPLGDLSDGALLCHFRALRAHARPVFKRHVLNTYGANVLASTISQICEAAGSRELASAAAASAGSVDSAAQSLDLWALSRLVRGSRVLTAAFDAGATGVLDRLRSSTDPDASRFLEEWERFIDSWGYLGPSTWEFRSPTYRSAPAIALRMLDRTRQAPDSDSPDVRAATLRERRAAAIGTIAERLGDDQDGRARFLGAARAVGKYLAARERSKMSCARVIDEARQAVRELGRRLVDRGALARWEHVLLVTDGEADAFLQAPRRYSAMIKSRAARLEMLKGLVPPFVFEGTAPPLSAFRPRGADTVEGTTPATPLEGIPVSPGRHTGRARVITSLDVECDLQPGEIIVATTTDASWGPLFLAAGAVVVETGAAISHASIVARELGIPAVASVTDATRRIPDGATITVDGDWGTVVIEP